ncbi:hypothetical protein, partial [Bradyrhizobium sp. 17]|uniref:hypothetical protein n=1 Tax=Bradyrhizobium sp. 17 TaxID=2782649 RepID=UPI001FFAB278
MMLCKSAWRPDADRRAKALIQQAAKGLILGSDSFPMKFAGRLWFQTENQRHADGLSNLIASTEWFGV